MVTGSGFAEQRWDDAMLACLPWAPFQKKSRTVERRILFFSRRTALSTAHRPRGREGAGTASRDVRLNAYTRTKTRKPCNVMCTCGRDQPTPTPPQSRLPHEKSNVFRILIFKRLAAQAAAAAAAPCHTGIGNTATTRFPRTLRAPSPLSTHGAASLHPDPAGSTPHNSCPGPETQKQDKISQR